MTAKRKSNKVTSPATIAALKKLAKSNGGLLMPEAVVEAARPKSSPLHRHFTWDDTRAAHNWRIEQARKLLQVTVEYIKDGKGQRFYRVFCSLSPDRDEGGYRVTTAVLSNKEMRAQLLEDARFEMQLFTRKYRELTELAGVFEAMRAAMK